MAAWEGTCGHVEVAGQSRGEHVIVALVAGGTR